MSRARTMANLASGLTSSFTELNLLDGVSGLVQADLTKLAAVDSSATELNLLDGVSGLVQADLTKLAAVDSSATELNLLDGVVGLVQADLTKLAAVDSSATELDYNNITTLGTSQASKVVTADASGHVIFADGASNVDIASHDGTNGLKLGGTLVTTTATTLNKAATTGKSIAMAIVFGG